MSMTVQTEQKRVPALRFPGFEGAWEEKRLGEISKINPRYNGFPNTFIYVDLESVEKGILKKEDIIQKENAPSRAQRVLQNDDILFQTVRPYQRNNFFFYKGDGYVASTGYAQIRTKQIPRYLYWFLHTECFVRKVLVRCTGTSYPAINSNDLAKITVSIPSLPEQQKIADFLTSIDTRIQQLTRKVALLEQYKKGVMQQIFSQAIRFQDDQGRDFPDWEVKKAGVIFRSHSNKNHNGELPILAITQDQGTIFRDSLDKEIKSSEASVKSYKIIEPGDFIISLRSFQGGIEYSGIKGICSPAYTILKPQIDIVPTFFKYYFKKESFISRLSATVIGIREGKQISYEAFSGLKLLFPSLPEQQKIADFLSAIDRKITHTKDQLEQMQRFKKGLLQQMFV